MTNDARRILIIEDDPGIGEMVKALLEFDGFEAILCEKPWKAVAKIQQYDPDLVILDLRLSGVDGTEVCAHIKKDESSKNIPVIMMSALSDAENICERAGADDFIAKPFDMDNLLKKIERVLKN